MFFPHQKSCFPGCWKTVCERELLAHGTHLVRLQLSLIPVICFVIPSYMFFVCLWIVFWKKTNLCQAIGSYRFVSKKNPVFRCRHFQPARMDPQELRISFAHRSKLSPFDPSVAWLSTKKKYKVTLYGTTVSHHLWKTKIIFNIDFSGDMLVPRRVLVINGVMGKWPKIIGFHWVLFHLYKWNCIILTCNCFFFSGPPW